MKPTCVKRCLPSLKRFVTKKLRRKLPSKVKVKLHRQGRIAYCYPEINSIHVSRRLCRENPTLAKAVLCHELAHLAGASERQAHIVERKYLKAHGTSFRREACRYRRSK